jgi:hypothetical protein
MKRRERDIMAYPPLENHYYIHIGDKYVDFDTLTEEQQKKISQALNEQAARTIVLPLEEETV